MDEGTQPVLVTAYASRAALRRFWSREYKWANSRSAAATVACHPIAEIMHRQLAAEIGRLEPAALRYAVLATLDLPAYFATSAGRAATSALLDREADLRLLCNGPPCWDIVPGGLFGQPWLTDCVDNLVRVVLRTLRGLQVPKMYLTATPI